MFWGSYTVAPHSPGVEPDPHHMDLHKELEAARGEEKYEHGAPWYEQYEYLADLPDYDWLGLMDGNLTSGHALPANWTDHHWLHDPNATFGDMNAKLEAGDFVPENLSPAIVRILTVAYAVVISLALAGNLMVMLVILRNSRLWTVTNMFLVSLAISDLLIAGLNMPLQLLAYVRSDWTLGEPLCKLGAYSQGVVIVASILTLLGIAVDRYYAICHPLKALYMHTPKRTVLVLAVFWVMAAVMLVPQIFIQRLEPRIHINADQGTLKILHVCVENYPGFALHVAYMLFFVSIYLVPVAVMLVAYSLIMRRLLVRQPIGEEVATPSDSSRRMMDKRRAVRMLLIIMVLFAASWFPFFAVQVYLVFHVHTSNSRLVIALLQLLGYSNSCANPVIYCFLNDNFQAAFLKTLCLRFRSARRRPRESTDVDKIQMSTQHSTV